MKPEKKTLGNMKVIDICSACIWFSGFGRDEQAEAEQSKHVNERGKHHRDDAAGDRHMKEESA